MIFVAYNLVVVPLHHGLALIVYVLGLYLVALSYALLHRALSDDGLWVSRWSARRST